MRKNKSRLEICGGIASGKTTLARLLRWARLTPVLEEFRRNPFLAAFYADPRGYALETELGFLLQHFHTIKKSARSRSLRACDFSLVLDYAYAKVTLDTKQQRQFRTLLRWITDEIGEASYLVHLTCPASVELQRIRRRGRRQEQSISERYLEDINAEVAELLTRASRVLVLDSHAVNFATNSIMQRDVLRVVSSHVRRRGVQARSGH